MKKKKKKKKRKPHLCRHVKVRIAFRFVGRREKTHRVKQTDDDRVAGENGVM